MRIADQTWATTAVTFWDGPPDILVAPTDLTSSDTDDNSDQVTIMEQALEGDTFSSGYALESVTGNGFGMLARLAGWWIFILSIHVLCKTVHFRAQLAIYSSSLFSRYLCSIICQKES